jgi:hypothetical protein
MSSALPKPPAPPGVPKPGDRLVKVMILSDHASGKEAHAHSAERLEKVTIWVNNGHRCIIEDLSSDRALAKSYQLKELRELSTDLKPLSTSCGISKHDLNSLSHQLSGIDQELATIKPDNENLKTKIILKSLDDNKPLDSAVAAHLSDRLLSELGPQIAKAAADAASAAKEAIRVKVLVNDNGSAIDEQIDSQQLSEKVRQAVEKALADAARGQQ